MNKVAIIIPTKNRLDFVIRTIQYYVSINCPHPIFIGDASSKSSKELVLNVAQEKIEVYYFHWENLSDRKTMVKLAQEASKVNITDYCAMQGDDDFFVPESLSKCAGFLYKNPEYATAQGRAFLFELVGGGSYGELKDIGIYWDLKELKGDTALERLKEIAANYWTPILSVHRINEYIDDTSNGIETIIDRNFGEYANSLSMAMRGKSKFIDCLYLARHVHSGIDHPTHSEWVEGENWQSSYNELILALSKVLSNNDKLSLTRSNNELKFALENLITTNNTSLLNFIKNKYSGYIGKRGVIYIFSKLYRRIKYSPILPSKDFSRQGLRSTKSKYYKDVSFILNSCMRAK